MLCTIYRVRIRKCESIMVQPIYKINLGIKTKPNKSKNRWKIFKKNHLWLIRSATSSCQVKYNIKLCNFQIQTIQIRIFILCRDVASCLKMSWRLFKTKLTLLNNSNTLTQLFSVYFYLPVLSVMCMYVLLILPCVQMFTFLMYLITSKFLR